MAALAPAAKHGSSAIEATKALVAHQAGGRHPAAIEPLPLVEVPAVASHTVVAMAIHTAGTEFWGTNSLWRV